MQKILAGKSPRERAAELINGTKVRDVAFRKQLYEGGAGAVSAANDPMIELARLVDAEARALRKVSEDAGRDQAAGARGDFARPQRVCSAPPVIRTRRSRCVSRSAR